MSVSGVFLVGGFGLGPFVKTRPHNLRFGEDQGIISLPGTAIEAFPYRDVSAIAVDGETITTGGGFIGGGFGVEGAAEGMAVASVLNALTTRTNIKTIREMQVGQSHFAFLSTTENARTLTTRLLPVKAKLRLNHAADEVDVLESEAARLGGS